MVRYAEPLTLGNMPAEIERLGIVEMFSVGNRPAEVGKLDVLLGNPTTVLVNVVVPLVIVVVPRSS